jgi:hypothetical protein
MIMALPLRLLKALQVTRPQKIGLAVVFCLGLIIVAVAIIRMTQILGEARTDPAGLALWGLVESSVAVIVGSLPPLKSFMQKKLAKYGTAGAYGYGRNGNSYAMGGSKGARNTGPLNSHKSAVVSSIPLEDRGDGSEDSVKDLKGEIVVTNSFGWERTESVRGDHNSTRYVHDDEEELVGMAVSDNSVRNRSGGRVDDKPPVEGKTWLRTSTTQ